VLSSEKESAICVQRYDDSLNSPIRISYRVSVRSSSLFDPRDSLVRVVHIFSMFSLLAQEILGFSLQ